MQSNPYKYRRKVQYVAIVFAAALIILLIAEFASFGVGAYYVYNKPISNVQAITSRNATGTILHVTAISLKNISQRSVWIDPQIQSDVNGNLLVNRATGFPIAGITTNSSGGISKSFRLNQSTLNGIQSDGQTIHEVWLIGTNATGSKGSSDLVQITSDSEENYSVSSPVEKITLFATLITFPLTVNSNFGVVFLALWTIYLILFSMALNGPLRSIWGSVRQASAKGTKALFDNSMFATLIIFPIIVWVTVALSLLEQAGGVATGSLPTVDPLLQFVELSLAPVREELGFRVIPIGLVALLILFSRGRIRDGLLALWHPSRYLKKNDSPAQYRSNLKTIYVVVGLSAILFGLAHVLLGAGWGPGKILSAAVAGVGLGALYYLYGFPAAVLLHWAIDYFLTTFDLLPVMRTYLDFITIYTLAISVAGSVVLILLLVRRFRNRSNSTVFPRWRTRNR
ncbi:MAG: CPBP family intramembrane metalloprotease [Thaumarchaeota archaeon]|nr:CPBP family intramembrane metalloprotease [Nitrososphaerota archaeon]